METVKAVWQSQLFRLRLCLNVSTEIGEGGVAESLELTAAPDLMTRSGMYPRKP